MSNLGLDDYLAGLGLGTVRTQVGDRYVVEAMRAGGYNLGGEQSGHVILLDRSTTGDGMMTALQILAVMARQRCALSDLLPEFHTHPQSMVNIHVAVRRPHRGTSRLRRGRSPGGAGSRRRQPGSGALQRDRTQSESHGRGTGCRAGRSLRGFLSPRLSKKPWTKRNRLRWCPWSESATESSV